MVERLAPPSKGQVEYFDKNLPGFALRVSYSGTKSWVLMTRVRGKLTRLTLGEWPSLTLADAHQAAREAKHQAQGGADPREVRRQRRQDAQQAEKLTFAGMTDDFLARYAKPKLRARTVEEYTRILKGHRTLSWHDRPVSSITRRDVIELLDCLESEGKHATARLALAYLRKFFNWCAEREAIATTPVERIRLNGSLKPRERALHVADLHRVWLAINQIGGTGGSLVKILMLTGQRRYETSLMRRRDVSGLRTGDAMWSIPGEITKNHRLHQVPLSPAAVAVILEQPVITANSLEKGNELVFTTNGVAPFSGWSKLKVQIDKRIAEDGQEPMTPWTFHDLRRSLVTGLNERGLVQPHVIEAIVNHVSGLRGGIAGVYNRAVYMEERRCALEAWATLVANTKILEGKNVVRLKK